METLKSTLTSALPSALKPTLPIHPFNPLETHEIARAVAAIQKEHAALKLAYNAITVSEPPKAQMLAWLAAPDHAAKPKRMAEVVCVDKESKVYEGLVDLETDGEAVIVEWAHVEGVQPLITMEDLIETDRLIRHDEKVIEQCEISGIPRSDMDKVYCDPWTIGYDERFGSNIRLQQALMYYRPHVDDSQYSFPLDFCPIVNTETKEVIHIDIPPVRRPVAKNRPGSNYNPKDIEGEFGGYRKDLKPIDISQPEGVSFTMAGHEIEWQNYKLHIGFNYREGIVLNNITYNDHGKVRPLFYRISLAEMVVPYGNPEHPHQRKHAFDLGEYGGGYMTNSLALGCDCKGAIHYLPFHHPTRAGSPTTIPNAVCIHEEDTGVLFKHTDFRDNSVHVTRGRKLVLSHIFTAANYEYCVYWSLHLDGTLQLEIKLTGILNTYAMNPGEDTHGWGTEVFPGVNAHNHQHLFCLRIDPQIDGQRNTIFQVDAVRGPHPLGHPENKYGNSFRAQKTPLRTVAESVQDYDATTGRTWDISNPKSIHPYSGKPATYKLISREIPTLLPLEGSLVWNRAGFARHAIHVTPYADGQLHPAGRHVPQTSGSPSRGLPEWMGDGSATVEDADVVLWHTFGVTHFPAPEDFPVMPAEPMGLILKPRNFFKQNPALDVPPSYSLTASQVKAGSKGVVDLAKDTVSQLAFGAKHEANGTNSAACCADDKQEGAKVNVDGEHAKMNGSGPPRANGVSVH